MAGITVVGSINRDIVAFVDRHPAPGETVLGQRSATFPGGKGANQAVAAARLRADLLTRVRMVGRIGFDSFGADTLRFLKDEAIDVAYIKATARASTGLALITVDRRGENAIAVVSGANHVWDGLDELPLGASDVVICQLEIPLLVVQAAFVQARAAKATTILNPAPFQNLDAGILARTDVLVLNEIELAQVLGRAFDDATDRSIVPAIRHLQSLGPRDIIVTLGAAGAVVAEATDRVTRLPGLAVQAVDTTGAGDCFVGALAAALIGGDDLVTAATFANRAAASSVTREGAAQSYPRRNDLA